MRNGVEIYRAIGERKTKAHIRNEIICKLYGAIEWLDKAYDLAEENNMENAMLEIQDFHDQIVEFIHRKDRHA